MSKMKEQFQDQIDGDDGAFPSQFESHGLTYTRFGLTKREYIAALAMQGALANPERIGCTREIAEASVTWAEALIKELSKESE